MHTLFLIQKCRLSRRVGGVILRVLTAHTSSPTENLPPWPPTATTSPEASSPIMGLAPRGGGYIPLLCMTSGLLTPTYETLMRTWRRRRGESSLSLSSEFQGDAPLCLRRTLRRRETCEQRGIKSAVQALRHSQYREHTATGGSVEEFLALQTPRAQKSSDLVHLPLARRRNWLPWADCDGSRAEGGIQGGVDDGGRHCLEAGREHHMLHQHSFHRFLPSLRQGREWYTSVESVQDDPARGSGSPRSVCVRVWERKEEDSGHRQTHGETLNSMGRVAYNKDDLGCIRHVYAFSTSSQSAVASRRDG